MTWHHTILCYYYMFNIAACDMASAASNINDDTFNAVPKKIKYQYLLIVTCSYICSFYDTFSSVFLWLHAVLYIVHMCIHLANYAWRDLGLIERDLPPY